MLRLLLISPTTNLTNSRNQLQDTDALGGALHDEPAEASPSEGLPFTEAC